MTTASVETVSVFWSEQGAVCCAKHAPYKNSDTWVNERWVEMSDSDLIAWARETGDIAKCECCGAAAYGRSINA